jgi:hypothetical protein
MESEAIRNLAAVLIRKTVILKDEIQQKLHARVGLLILENDFLKKIWVSPLERAS